MVCEGHLEGLDHKGSIRALRLWAFFLWLGVFCFGAFGGLAPRPLHGLGVYGLGTDVAQSNHHFARMPTLNQNEGPARIQLMLRE